MPWHSSLSPKRATLSLWNAKDVCVAREAGHKVCERAVLWLLVEVDYLVCALDLFRCCNFHVSLQPAPFGCFQDLFSVPTLATGPSACEPQADSSFTKGRVHKILGARNISLPLMRVDSKKLTLEKAP